MSITTDITSTTIEQFDPNQLVTIQDHPGTHTVREFRATPPTCLVDVHGALLEVPAGLITTHPGTPRQNKHQHTIVTHQQERLTTAVNLNVLRARHRASTFGPDTSQHPALTGITLSRDVSFTGLAKIIVRPRTFPVEGGRPALLSAAGLELDVTIKNNLDKTAVPYDLIPIVLENNQRPLDTILVLTMPSGPQADNVVQFTVRYTLAQLLALAGARPVGSPAEQIATIEKLFPELGVKATWLDFNGNNNADNHHSGGVKNKDGSGKLKIVAPSQATLAAAEKHRLTTWTASEDLGPDRAVFTAFPGLLQSGQGKQLATTVEAEAEFVLETEAEYHRVLGLFETLTSSPKDWPGLGIRSIEAVRNKHDELETVYTDTYYDVIAGGVCQWTLFNKRIVLRRRSVATDEGDVYLLALKGTRLTRTYKRDEERLVDYPEALRLGAQVQLQPNHTPEELTAFLLDVSTDNAVGRILDDAIRKDAVGKSYSDRELAVWPAPPKKWVFGPALVVTSWRRKFSIQLANSTTIDVTVDRATAVPKGSPVPGAPVAPMCFSFELGVGHPALIITGTASVPEVPATVSPSDPPDDAGRITRPYHVPSDLKPDFFGKVDYRQFAVLTQRLLGQWFPDKRPAIGGNKAVLLAQKLRLVK